MSDGPPNFHQLFNASREFLFESTARYERSMRRIDDGTAGLLGRELVELIGEWQTPTLNLSHFQARWVLKSVRAARQYQRFLVIECYVHRRKYRMLMTIDTARETVWLLDIWQKSGSAKEQSQVIDRAFELAKTILESSDD